MNFETEIQQLIRARHRMEQRIQELDLRIEAIYFRLDEERRCMARKCPFDDNEIGEDADRKADEDE